MIELLEKAKLESQWTTVVQQLGEPLKTTKRGDVSIYWYTTAVPGSADLIYVKNDRVSMVSLNVESREKTVRDYVLTYQQPENTLIVEEATSFSDQKNLSIWPNDGAAVFSIGTSVTGLVTREIHFTPTSTSAFLSTYFPQYESTKETSLVATSSAVPTQILLTPISKQGTESSAMIVPSQIPAQNYIRGLGILISTIFIVGIIVVAILKYRSRPRLM